MTTPDVVAVLNGDGYIALGRNQKGGDYPGAVKCHWFIRQTRGPALWELVMKLDAVYNPLFHEHSTWPCLRMPRAKGRPTRGRRKT